MNPLIRYTAGFLSVLGMTCAVIFHAPLVAQTEPDSAPATATPGRTGESPSPPPSSSRPARRNTEQQPQGTSSAGTPGGLKLLEAYDPVTGNLTWKGRSFSLGDTDIAQARFERFLTTPPADGEADLAYNKTLEEITQTLQGRKGGTLDQRVAQGWRLLYRAADYEGDSRLCETLGNILIAHWQSNERIRDILQETKQLEKKREAAEANITRTKDWDRNVVLDNIRNNTAASGAPPARDYAAGPFQKRLDEAERSIEENRKLETTSRLNQKLEFQGMIFQFFAQRRFQHVLIALDFYRYLFPGDQGDLEAAAGMKRQLLGDMDMRITTSAVEALTREAVREVEVGAQSVNHLLERGQTWGAMQRLTEMFHLGEFLPVVKTFPLEQKEKVRDAAQILARLNTALEAKDLEQAELLLAEAAKQLPDFDTVKPRAFIITTKQASNLALQKAAMAAKQDNAPDAEAALRQAMEVWPANPGIARFSSLLETRTDMQSMAATDFDRLLAANEHRAIFNDRFRFAAALHNDEARNKQFLDIMRRVEMVETAIAQASELERTRNTAGAWEVIERAWKANPDDLRINKARGDLAVKASAFASLVSKAENDEQQGQLASALLAWLDAREKYPASFFADEGIARLCKEILRRKAGAGAQPQDVVAQQ
ncbi:MAG: hypothetical protein LBK99_21500 [Opitutaceae bacterium]|nr:hypothetical protein [Opitutaceae bacterium]